MRPVIRGMFYLSLGLELVSAALAGERLLIGKILRHPADYQARVVTVEGRARAVRTLPAHRGTPRCGGSAVYDSQMFTLQDESGTIGIGTGGTCRPNVIRPVVENERLRIRGVVVADDKSSGGIPVIYAEAIDRVRP